MWMWANLRLLCAARRISPGMGLEHPADPEPPHPLARATSDFELLANDGALEVRECDQCCRGACSMVVSMLASSGLEVTRTVQHRCGRFGPPASISRGTKGPHPAKGAQGYPSRPVLERAFSHPRQPHTRRSVTELWLAAAWEAASLGEPLSTPVRPAKGLRAD